MGFDQRLQEVRTGFERPFWVANISEIFERLAYYGAFASLANYLARDVEFSDRANGGRSRDFFGGMVWFLAIFRRAQSPIASDSVERSLLRIYFWPERISCWDPSARLGLRRMRNANADGRCSSVSFFCCLRWEFLS